MTIKMASKEGTFCIVGVLIVAMAAAGAIRSKESPDGSVQWLSFVALDMLHRVIPSASLQRLRMTIEIACDGGTFARRCQYFACHYS
jgi:hypothetical protein